MIQKNPTLSIFSSAGGKLYHGRISLCQWITIGRLMMSYGDLRTVPCRVQGRRCFSMAQTGFHSGVRYLKRDKDFRYKNKVPRKGPAMHMMDDFQQRKHQHLTNGLKDALKITRIKNVLISTEDRARINELKQQSQKFRLNKENFYN